jgi:copper chaperone CopZ
MSKTILNVEGMSCPSCVSHVSEALGIPGVETINVQLDQGAVEIEHDASVPMGRLIAALEKAGYEARPRDQGGNV